MRKLIHKHKYEFECLYCGEVFYSDAEHAKYCSDSHKVQAYRRRKTAVNETNVSKNVEIYASKPSKILDNTRDVGGLINESKNTEIDVNKGAEINVNNKCVIGPECTVCGVYYCPDGDDDVEVLPYRIDCVYGSKYDKVGSFFIVNMCLQCHEDWDKHWSKLTYGFREEGEGVVPIQSWSTWEGYRERTRRKQHYYGDHWCCGKYKK